MAHFTYVSEPSKSELLQGDVLQRTPDILGVLKEFHPHYTQEKYTHFQVITQSCDLTTRDSGVCKGDYITLAAVRPVGVILGKEIDQYASMGRLIEISDKKFCSDKIKSVLKEYLRKLYNNNNPNYFFLRRDYESGFNEDCCTVLQLSIPIRRDHYRKCLDAKILELTPNFRDKLGWLVGNIYSRIGTDDFVPAAVPTSAEFNEMLDSTLESYLAWVPDKHLPMLKKAARSTTEESLEVIMRLMRDEIDKKLNSKITPILNVIGRRVDLEEAVAESLKKDLIGLSIIRELI